MKHTPPPALTCRECREYLPAYTQQELAVPLRHRVGAHLDNCPACSAIWRSQREVTRDLRATLPAVGLADPRRLSGLWTAIQQEMVRPRRAPAHPRRISASAALMLATLGLTLSLGANRLSLALPVMPTPTVFGIDDEGAARTEAQVAMVSRIVPVQRSSTPPSGPITNRTVTPPGAPRYAPTETTPTEMP